MNYLDGLQWLSFALSVAGSFLVAQRTTSKRFVGFALFLISNLVLAVWAANNHYLAIMLTQCMFIGSSIWGMLNNRSID